MGRPLTLGYHLVNVFTRDGAALSGNPLCVFEDAGALDEGRMQALARQFNLSETTFLLPPTTPAATHRVRIFTPDFEMPFAGHLVLDRLDPGASAVLFESGGKMLEVRRDGPSSLVLEMPALRSAPIATPPALAQALGREPRAVLAAKHYRCVFETADEIAALAPDMAMLAGLDLAAVTVTAPASPGDDADFVSRFFAPANGVPEDPVSGVAHLALAPYWSERLGKKKLLGRQLSRRGGLVVCEDLGARVSLGGSAVIFLEGSISI